MATTPQVFVDSTRRFLSVAVPDPKALTYTPVLVVFAVAALLALAVSDAAFGTVLTPRAAEWFVSFAMCLLAMLKLCAVESFSSGFLNYDLLARRRVP